MTAAPSRTVDAARASGTPGVRVGNAGRASYLLWLLILYLVLEYARPPVIVRFKLQMVISLILPVLCFALIKDRRWSWSLTCQLCLIAVAASGVLYASNYYAAYFTTRILYTTVAISISMAWLLARLDFFRRGMWAWTLIMTYLGLFGLASGGFGPGGIIGDENELALACNTAVPMAYFGAVSSRGWKRLVYAGIGLVLLASIVISLSRGGFVGLVGIVGYIILISKYRLRAIAGIAIAAAVFYVAVPRTYINEVLSIGQEASGEVEDGTGDIRLFLWQTAFNMWKDNPILGVGAGNSRYNTGKYQADWEGPLYSGKDWSGMAIHSGFFELLSEMGSAGVFFYGAMIANHFAVLRGVRRLARKTRGIPSALRDEMEMYSGALAAGMIGYLGSGLFLSVAYHPYAFYFAALSLALSWGLDVELARLAAARENAAPRAPVSGTPAVGPASPSPAAPPSLGKGLLSGPA
ncbi:MAG: O-antigen ligase family protein [Myxococcota bacterium]